MRRPAVSPLIALLAAGAVAGIALRIWVLASPLAVLDADEAVWGLMARHTLAGEFPTFFWGQAYGGSQETLLAAGVFALSGAGTFALRLVPLVLFAGAAILVWRVGRRTVGEPGARIAAVLFWMWPAYLVWKSTRAHGFYAFGLVCALAAILFALRLAERESRRDLAGLGLMVGLGWWATPLSALLSGPVLLWLGWRRPRILRAAWVPLASAVVGAAPWLVWNAGHEWQSLETPFGPGGDTYVDHVRTFFYATLPSALGVRVPFSLDWLLGEVAGRVLELAALVAFAWLLLRRRRRREPLLLVGLFYPLLQSLSPFTSLNEEPRYLVMLIPVVALLLGELLARHAVTAAAGLAAALVLSIGGLAAMRAELVVPPVGGKRMPADLEPVLGTLAVAGIHRVFAEYWIAYRITFETHERIVATSTGQVRSEAHDRLVRASPRVAYVFVAGSRTERQDGPRLGERDYRRVPRGGFAVYLPPSDQET